MFLFELIIRIEPLSSPPPPPPPREEVKSRNQLVMTRKKEEYQRILRARFLEAYWESGTGQQPQRLMGAKNYLKDL